MRRCSKKKRGPVKPLFHYYCNQMATKATGRPTMDYATKVEKKLVGNTIAVNNFTTMVNAQ